MSKDREIIEGNDNFRKNLLEDIEHRIRFSRMTKDDPRKMLILQEISNWITKTKNDKSALTNWHDHGFLVLNDGTSDGIFWAIKYFDQNWLVEVDPCAYPEYRRLLLISNIYECM